MPGRKRDVRNPEGPTGRMDPALDFSDTQSPFAGQGFGNPEAGNAGPGGGGLPFTSLSQETINTITPAAAQAGSGAGMTGAGMSTMELLKLFGIQTGMDILGGLISGGDDDPGEQDRESFRAPGQMQDPQHSIRRMIEGYNRMGNFLTDYAQQPIDMSAAGVQDITPINVEGIPFQIGGGFATDPGIGAGPAALPDMYDPFQSYGKVNVLGQGAQPGPPAPDAPRVRRRSPGGGQ